jgi:hypothetical protein
MMLPEKRETPGYPGVSLLATTAFDYWRLNPEPILV